MSNELVEAWLHELGMQPLPEPDWIAGRKPDFFCQGTYPAWVEVKSLDEPEHVSRMGRAWIELRDRASHFQTNGSIDAVIGDGFDSKAAKVAVAIVAQCFREGYEYHEHIVVIPGDPDYSRRVRAEYVGRDGRQVVQVGPAARSRTYRCYPSLEPRSWGEAVLVSVAGEPVGVSKPIG